MEYNSFIKKIDSLKFVAHRIGFKMSGYPENSIDSLKYILDNKKVLNALNGIEFDIRFTKDNVPIVIHDKCLDDISDRFGKVKHSLYEDIKNVNCSFRKTEKINKTYTFKISTLDEFLGLLNQHNNELKDFKIRVESKRLFKRKNLKKLAEVIDKYPLLKDNIVHISFYPQNLTKLKRIQEHNNHVISKNDLLCDFNSVVFLSRFFKRIDAISLRIKDVRLPKISKNNTKMVNRTIAIDKFTMNFSNSLSDKAIKYAIEKGNVVNIYTLNDKENIKVFCKNISEEIFNKYSTRMIFTSDNPIKIKSATEKNNYTF